LNLKKLQSIARRRLGLTGEVEFVQKSGWKGKILANSGADSSMQIRHTITYFDADSIDPADILHELCRARLYELGFRTVENAALMALKNCAGDDPKFIFDANSSIVIVSEVYVSWMLYLYFHEEAESRRQEIVLRFESSDALTTLHTQMGFWGTAGIAYYKLASRWADKIFPSKQVEAAISRASDGKLIEEELRKIETVLSELPRIEKPIQVFSDSDQLQIISVIADLFSAKTGIDCS